MCLRSNEMLLETSSACNATTVIGNELAASFSGVRHFPIHAKSTALSLPVTFRTLWHDVSSAPPSNPGFDPSKWVISHPSASAATGTLLLVTHNWYL